MLTYIDLKSAKAELITALSPIKKISYFEDYFSTIKKNHFLGLQLKVKIYFAILLLEQLNTFFIKSKTDSELSKIMRLDYLYFLKMPETSQIIFINIFYQTFVYHYLMYIKAFKSDFSRLPYQILIKENAKVFLSPYFKNQSICVLFRKRAFFWLNAYQSFTHSCGMLLMFKI